MLTKFGQLGLRIAQFLGDQRAERRIADRRLRQVAGAQQVGGPAVVAFLGAHRADDGQVFGQRGDLGQMLADLDARDAAWRSP